jgi:hypothetical protein
MVNNRGVMHLQYKIIYRGLQVENIKECGIPIELCTNDFGGIWFVKIQKTIAFKLKILSYGN